MKGIEAVGKYWNRFFKAFGDLRVDYTLGKLGEISPGTGEAFVAVGFIATSFTMVQVSSLRMLTSCRTRT